MTVSEFIQLLAILIWPITFLTVVILFKSHLSKAFERLGSIQAGPTGLALTFEKALETAKETIEASNPGTLATAKSVENSAFAKAYNTPYEQLVSIKKSLDETIVLLATEKGLSISGKSSAQMLQELSSVRAIRANKIAPLSTLLTAVDSAPLAITKEQVNTLQSLHDAL